MLSQPVHLDFRSQDSVRAAGSPVRLCPPLSPTWQSGAKTPPALRQVGMQQQVLLVGSAGEGSITAWSLATGSYIFGYKESRCSKSSLTLVGRDHLAAAQANRASVHFWTWHKDQVQERSFVAERLTALAASPDGSTCAGGGVSGALYAWDVASGRLLRTWPAHYQAVSCLAFTDDSNVLVSAAGDTTAHAWLLPDVLDAASAQNGSMTHLTPMHSWSEHTLPITSMQLGAGRASPILVSASLDCTCKFFSVASGVLLRSLTFPTAVHSLALQPGEQCIYAGASDGRIFEASLVGDLPAAAGPSAAATANETLHDEPFHTLRGHDQSVNALAFSNDARLLISGSEDGSVRVWDAPTRQTVRTLTNPAKGPIACLLVLDRPPFMAAGQGASRGLAPAPGAPARASGGPKRPQPLGSLAKFQDGTGWQGAPVLLHGCLQHSGCCSLSASPGLSSQQSLLRITSSLSGPTTSAAETSRLAGDLQAAQAEAAKWKQLCSQLHTHEPAGRGDTSMYKPSVKILPADESSFMVSSAPRVLPFAVPDRLAALLAGGSDNSSSSALGKLNMDLEALSRTIRDMAGLYRFFPSRDARRDQQSPYIARAVAGMTSRQLASQALPTLPQPKDTGSKSEGCRRCTFSDAQPLLDFQEGVDKLLALLDDTHPTWEGGLVRRTSGENNTMQEPADQEEEVRGMLTARLFDELNLLAGELQLPVRLKGGGGRMSFADAIGYVKEKEMKRPVITIEVKGSWQCKSLQQEATITRALQTDAGKHSLLHAMTQAFGDAVMEEVRVLALTDYTATVFFIRSERAASKDLAYSPTIFSDGRHGLPPRASWLYVMQQAGILDTQPKSMDRELVPATGDGHPFVHSKPCRSSDSSPRTSQPKRQAKKRQQPEERGDPCRLKAAAPRRFSLGPADGQTWTGQAARASGSPLTYQRPAGPSNEQSQTPGSRSCAEASQRSQQEAASPHVQMQQPGLCDAAMSNEQEPLPDAQGPSSSSQQISAQPAPISEEHPGLQDLDDIPDLVLEDELIIYGQYGHCIRAQYKEMLVFAKRYNLKVRGSQRALGQEVKNFNNHQLLQGDIIPQLHVLGFHPGTTDPILIMQDCGEAVPTSDGRIRHGFKGLVRDAITKFYDKTLCCHGYLRPANMLMSSDPSSRKIMLIDLASMEVASHARQAAEAEYFEKYYM
ncbi:hypothetical protein WJX74_004888 [Apatococcus lobatus]|uniref:Uncharacterized protein n=1 Tax=Apatococcus lobatus TaxID=904363 RepID=A0AAW1QB48_9CHLO